MNVRPDPEGIGLQVTRWGLKNRPLAGLYANRGLKMTTPRTCGFDTCSASLDGKRSDAVYCSTLCRVKAHQHRKVEQAREALTGRHMTDRDC